MQEELFINQPVFLKYKHRFNWRKLRREPFIKKAIINERIIEIPFVINELSRVSKGSRVLDLGCMESALPLFISGLGYKVTGFDFRKYPYRVPNFKFVQGSILELPFKNGYFDVVTCVSTIEHVGIGFYNDPKRKISADLLGINEIKRVLRPKGVFVLTVPFGKAAINNQQRIYGKKELDELVDGFELKELCFYKNVKANNGNNYWQRIDLPEAEKMEYTEGTECVCTLSSWRA